jgi:O-antigen/teichoic acid export membrane protein
MVGSTIWLGLASVFSIGLGLASTIVATRHFTTEVFGAFVLLQVIVSFLTQVSGFGLDLSIAKFVAGTEDIAQKRDLVGTAILFRLGMIVVASVVATVARSLLSRLFGASLAADLLVYLPVLFLLESLRTLLKSILQGYLLFPRIAIADSITSLLNLLLLLAFVLFLGQGIVGLILARAGALSAACIFAYLSIPVRKKLVFRLDLFKDLVRFGLPLELNDIMTFVFTRIDTLIIAALLGPADVALYEIARRIPDSLRQLYEPFRSVYFAFISRLYALREQYQLERLLNESMRVISFGTLLGAAIALLFAKDIIGLVFSTRYLPSAPVFALLMINLSVALVANMMGTSLVAMGDSDKPAIINIAHTGASLLSTVLLIPPFGIMGAAVASMLGILAVYPLSMIFLRRRAPNVGVTPYLKPLLIFFCWAALGLLLKPATFLPRTGFVAFFLLLCLLLSVITKTDVSILLRELRVTSWGPIKRLWPGRVKT